MFAVEFQLTQDDYAEAQLSHYRRKLEKIFVPGMVVLGGALVVTFGDCSDGTGKDEPVGPSWIFLAALFLLVCCDPECCIECSSVVCEPFTNQFAVYRTGKCESATKWEAFEKWEESKGASISMFSQGYSSWFQAGPDPCAGGCIPRASREPNALDASYVTAAFRRERQRGPRRVSPALKRGEAVAWKR